MDSNYATIAGDIQRVLPEEYLVSDVTPVRYSKVSLDPSVPDVVEKVGNLDMGQWMGVFVELKDEYREGWWRNAGGNPSIVVGFDKRGVFEPAGLADQVAPEIERRFKKLIKELNPPKTEVAKAPAKVAEVAKAPAKVAEAKAKKKGKSKG